MENKTPVVKQTDITSDVLRKVEQFRQSGELKIPSDYSPENALKSAYLVLTETKTKDGKPVLETCTKASIANALLKMVTLGLSPLKKQGDFIAYGNQLSFQEEYTGNIALAKRYGNLKSIKANAVFKDDEFVFEVGEDGRKKLVKHKQTISSIDTEVVGAYAVVELNDGTSDVEIMSIQQIRNAWNQGAMKGNSPAHKNFTDQMAIKTVINRACKLLIRGSNDAIFMDNDNDASMESRNQTIQSANSKEINTENIEYEEVSDTAQNNEVKEVETESVPQLDF